MIEGKIRFGLMALALPALVVVMLLAAAPEASVAAQGTGFTTPTPGPDGKIIYVVKEGDDLWTIAALSGKSVEELMALNGVQPGDFITPGMQLLLGLAGPALPTAAPEARSTPTLRPVTPTPVFGTGEICILLFLDVNGNARLDTGETALPGGQISIAEPSGVLAGEATTGDALEGRCFQGLLNGDYNVSAAAPQHYNPTTSMNIPVRLAPGCFRRSERVPRLQGFTPTVLCFSTPEERRRSQTRRQITNLVQTRRLLRRETHCLGCSYK